ncbi:MAG: hypothetical protein A2252_04440 [Elusimicrobia bacterium RIFOXYA2_FULL_39_19]|nr:MAG: hypothetical protein A2252_04440 [Elusimicrobia bacterium RIFOXYA2_FULL_39_19]
MESIKIKRKLFTVLIFIILSQFAGTQVFAIKKSYIQLDKDKTTSVKSKRFSLGISEIGIGNGTNDSNTKHLAGSIGIFYFRYSAASNWVIESHPFSIFIYMLEKDEKINGIFYNNQAQQNEEGIIENSKKLDSSYLLTTLLKYRYLKTKFISAYMGGGISLQRVSYQRDEEYYDIKEKWKDRNMNLDKEEEWRQIPCPVVDVGFELFSNDFSRIDIDTKYFFGKSYKSYNTDIFVFSVGATLNW